MVTATDTAQLRDAQRGIVALISRDLEAFFASLDLDRPEAARDALIPFLPALIERYGLGSAAIAADWYDRVRLGDAVKGKFRAVPVEPHDVEVRTEATVRRAAGYLFVEGSAGLALPALLSPASKYVLEPARETVAVSASLDPQARGWRWVARPAACDWCKNLARIVRTRTYSADTDHFEAHGNCSCTTAPAWAE